MKLTLTSVLFMLIGYTAAAQTKLISFKSHSGNLSNFRKAINNNLFDISQSNFGIVIRTVYKIDSVVNKNGKLIVYKNSSEIGVKNPKVVVNIDTLNLEDSKAYLATKSESKLKLKLSEKYGEKFNVTNTVFVGFDKQLNRKK